MRLCARLPADGRPSGGMWPWARCLVPVPVVWPVRAGSAARAVGGQDGGGTEVGRGSGGPEGQQGQGGPGFTQRAWRSRARTCPSGGSEEAAPAELRLVLVTRPRRGRSGGSSGCGLRGFSQGRGGARALQTGGWGSPGKRRKREKGSAGVLVLRTDPGGTGVGAGGRCAPPSPPPDPERGRTPPLTAGRRAAHPLWLALWVARASVSPSPAPNMRKWAPPATRLPSSPRTLGGGVSGPCSSRQPRWPHSRQDPRLGCPPPGRGLSRGRGQGQQAKAKAPPTAPLHPVLCFLPPAPRCRRSTGPEPSGWGEGLPGPGAEPPPRRPRWGPPPLFLFLPSSLSPLSRLLAPLLFCALPARAPARPAHR